MGYTNIMTLSHGSKQRECDIVSRLGDMVALGTVNLDTGHTANVISSKVLS